MNKMKSTITILTEFLEDHGMSIVTINLKLSDNGQVEYCTGTFRKSKIGISIWKIADEYRNRLSLSKMFWNTEIEVTLDNKFIIINNAIN